MRRLFALIGLCVIMMPTASHAQVLRYNGTTGAFIDAFVSSGSGGLDMPSGLTFGPDGNLYVVPEPFTVTVFVIGIMGLLVHGPRTRC